MRILVGFPAGTAPDVAARIVADKFALNWGKPVVVENVTGASGNIAVDRVAKAPRDGYTLLMGGNSSLIMSVSLNDKLPFDPVKDFVADHPDLRRREPAGGASRRAGEEHRGAGRARARRSPASSPTAIPAPAPRSISPASCSSTWRRSTSSRCRYRGSTAVLPDLLGGRLTMSFSNVVNAAPLVREGKLRAFAVTSRKRSVAAPDLPTMAEMRLSGLRGGAVVRPAGADRHAAGDHRQGAPGDREDPRDAATCASGSRTPGLDVIGSSPAEFAEVIKTEIPYWAKIIKEAGIKASE